MYWCIISPTNSYFQIISCSFDLLPLRLLFQVSNIISPMNSCFQIICCYFDLLPSRLLFQVSNELATPCTHPSFLTLSSSCLRPASSTSVTRPSPIRSTSATSRMAVWVIAIGYVLCVLPRFSSADFLGLVAVKYVGIEAGCVFFVVVNFTYTLCLGALYVGLEQCFLSFVLLIKWCGLSLATFRLT